LTQFPAHVRDKLIVAIDTPNLEDAKTLIQALKGGVGYFKIGLGLVPIGGIELARQLVLDGERVFLDLKLFDIHQTVLEATARIAEMGVHILTLQGDPHVIRAAVAGRAQGRGAATLALFGVTVLTSLDQTDIDEIGFPEPLDALTLRRAQAISEAGADGVIASGHETRRIKQGVGGRLRIITPGIRSAGIGAQDQKRVMTPRQAIDAGADHLVVGRQITQAPSPRAAADAILEEIGG